jgi:hypothetical protein
VNRHPRTWSDKPPEAGKDSGENFAGQASNRAAPPPRIIDFLLM